MSESADDDVSDIDAVESSPRFSIPDDAPAGSSRPVSLTHARRYVVAQLGVTAFALVMFGWNVARNEWSNKYYAAAVRSMGSSWHAFRYAAVDSGGWVTVDKPPMAFWLQSFSTRLFGFHPWAMMLPTVLLGGASVWLLMATVGRVAGRPAGLLSGVLLALTPITVAMSRSNMPDMTLTFFLVVAGWAAVRSYSSPSWRWPILIGVGAAAGFLSKSVAVGLGLPGIGIGYLVGGKGRLSERVVRGLGAVGVFVALVGLWLASVDLQGVGERPWIGGSSDGSAWRLVFGYNVSVLGGEGGLPPGFGRGPGPLAGLFMAFGGERGIGRMFNSAMGDQVMWWFPLAVFGALVGIIGGGRWRRRDPLFAATVMWTLWVLVSIGLFSFTKGVLHPYYVVVFAPPLAALSAVGAVRSWDAVDAHLRIGATAALLATGGLQLLFVRRGSSYGWLRTVLVVAMVVAAASTVVRRRSVGHQSQGWRKGAGTVVGAAMLVGPMLWSLSAVRHQVGGLFPAARPGTDSMSFGPPSSGAPYGFSDFGENTLKWLDEHRSTQTWSVAMSSAMVAEDAIIAGHRVVALGGFSGGDGSANSDRVADAVADGRLRYVLAGGGSPDGLTEPRVFEILRSVCTLVPADSWGGQGVSGVYDCAGKANQIRTAANAQQLGE